MLTYYIEGGALFMGMLSIVFLIIFVLSVLNGVVILSNKVKDDYKISNRLTYIKSLGLFGLVLGILGQFIGLFEAFKVIEQGIDISPAMLAGGVRVSSITSIYGIIIFLVAYVLWFALDTMLRKNKSSI